MAEGEIYNDFSRPELNLVDVRSDTTLEDLVIRAATNNAVDYRNVAASHLGSLDPQTSTACSSALDAGRPGARTPTLLHLLPKPP